MSVYYGKQTPGQMKSIITRPVAGINDYTPSTRINDNYMSDMLDCEPYRDEALHMFAEPSPLASYIYGATDGHVAEVIAIPGTVSINNVATNGYLAMVQSPLYGVWDFRRLDADSGVVTSYPIEPVGLPVGNIMQFGHWEENITGWTSSSISILSILPYNYANFTATAQYGGLQNGTATGITGKRYFVISYVNNPVANALRLKVSSSASPVFNQTVETGGVFLGVSLTASTNNPIAVRIEDSRASGWTPCEIYYTMVIDVTGTALTDVQLLAYYSKIPYLSFIDDLGAYFTHYYSSCIFNTQANQYMCFSCSASKNLYYFESKQNINSNIPLPFYPKKILSHLNRVFALDINNQFWWCRAGDLFSWYSSEYNDAMIGASQNMKVGAYTILAQPDITRPLTATVTLVGTADTMGTINIVGTINGVSQTETISPVAGKRVQTLKSFTTVTTITGVGWVIGTTNDTITFGVAPVSGGFVQDDAGNWTIENEYTLSDFCVLSDTLFIFSPSNIYAFRGTAPNNFSLSRYITDLGIIGIAGYKYLVTSNNVSYFWSNKDLYEFNGNSSPRIISRPNEINGANQNSIFGGILPTVGDLVSDTDNVYVLFQAMLNLVRTDYLYRFNTNTRAWYKISSFSNTTDLEPLFNTKYIPVSGNTGLVAFKTSYTGGFEYFYTAKGYTATQVPYVVTKSYNNDPSEKESLSTLVLQVKGSSAYPSTIRVSYALTVDATTYTLFKTFSNYTFNNDIENLEIPLPVNLISNKHHYKIKIESTNDMYLYNIERRFRVRGRSR